MFGKWTPFEKDNVDAFPDAACAVQLRRADGLVRYPEGKSAMVLYFFASASARSTLQTVLSAELEAPGASGQGPLWVRFGEDDDDQMSALAKLFETFVHRFGAPPILTSVLTGAANDTSADSPR